MIEASQSQAVVDSALIAGMVIKLGFGFAALFMVYFALKALDWSAGIKFRNSWEEILEGNIAVAVYHGLRILAVCILVGYAL